MSNGRPNIVSMTSDSVSETHEDSSQSGSTATTASTKAKKHKASKKKAPGKGQPLDPGQGSNPKAPKKDPK